MELQPDSAADLTQSPIASSQPDGALTALRRFAKSRPEVERCDLCGATLNTQHPHLLDCKSRHIVCSCDACAILFSGQEGAKFLYVPRRILKPQSFRFTDAEWDSMMLPINLAFFIRQPNGDAAALYPSPAGVMESMIQLPPWDRLFASDTALLEMQPEVEALLINRIGDANASFVVPIDVAYRLVGIIRTRWRGLSGGADVWQAISTFFADLDRQALPLREGSHA
ncbi:MAG: DUF5947 family protein [Acidobacteriaceae bacterium]